MSLGRCLEPHSPPVGGRLSTLGRAPPRMTARTSPSNLHRQPPLCRHRDDAVGMRLLLVGPSTHDGPRPVAVTAVPSGLEKISCRSLAPMDAPKLRTSRWGSTRGQRTPETSWAKQRYPPRRSTCADARRDLRAQRGHRLISSPTRREDIREDRSRHGGLPRMIRAR